MEDHRKQHKKPDDYRLSKRGKYERSIHSKKRERANKISKHMRMNELDLRIYCDDCTIAHSHIHDFAHHGGKLLLCKSCYSELMYSFYKG